MPSQGREFADIDVDWIREYLDRRGKLLTGDIMSQVRSLDAKTYHQLKNAWRQKCWYERER